MNTKTLLLLGVVGAVGLGSASAQVYSVNAVGYINVSVPANQFKMIANQLSSASATIGALLPTVPDGTQLFKWTGSGYASYDYIDGLGWLPNGDETIGLGQGAFIRSPQAFTITFVGEVPTGNLSTPLPVGFSMVSSQVPQAGAVDTLGFPGGDGDQIFQWTGTGYNGFDFIDGLGWLPSVPQVAVGEAFFARKVAASTWTRSFSVN